MESWQSALEFKLRNLEKFDTRQAACAAVAAWIGANNQHRRHSGIGMRSPTQYEREIAAAQHRDAMSRPAPSLARDYRVVLAGIKTTPFVWPSASHDTACGRQTPATIERGPTKQGRHDSRRLSANRADLRAEAKALHHSIAAQVEQLQASAEWARFLRFAASFHQYSLNNVLPLTTALGKDGWAVARA